MKKAFLFLLCLFLGLLNNVKVANSEEYIAKSYVVLEKEEVNTTITPHNSSESQKVDINVNIKEKPHVPHYSFGG